MLFVLVLWDVKPVGKESKWFRGKGQGTLCYLNKMNKPARNDEQWTECEWDEKRPEKRKIQKRDKRKRGEKRKYK